MNCNHSTRKIYFNNKNARTQLLEYGSVYTLRRPSFYHNGIEMAISDKTEIGEVKVSFIKEIFSIDDLIPYVDNSGFKSAREWWDVAFWMHPGLKSYYMYLAQYYKDGNIVV
jgi:hypothetical protein